MPLPKWVVVVLHVSILLVTGLAGATQLPGIANSLGFTQGGKDVALAVAGAGWIATYFLKSPLVLGWLSLHDPEDVEAAAQKAADKMASMRPPPPSLPTA